MLVPLLTMAVFTIFFGILAKVPSEDIPYPIFAYTALVPWNYFQNTISQTSTSMVLGKDLVSKVYFPRIIIPLASLLSGLVDFILAFVVLVALMFYYEIVPTANIVFLPVFLVFAMVTAFGVGLWLATLNVLYRDVAFITPFIVQFWLFASPIAYPTSIVPARWRTLYGLNPMVGVADGFRWAMLGTGSLFPSTLAMSVAISIFLLITGVVYFKHYERTFADII